MFALTLPGKIAATVASLAAVVIIARLAATITEGGTTRSIRRRFWIHQSVRIVTTLIWIALVLTVWIEDTSRVGTILALMTAGLTVALQKVITSIAGYISILRGDVFSVGDRITMSGVRGDVVALSYLRTTIMEMGQPPAVQDDDPAMWVSGRQYTGRLVTVTNDTIFDTPVYNYTREFPFIWDEIRVPIRYESEWKRVEEMLLDVARRHTAPIADAAREALPLLTRRFTLAEIPAVDPQVFLRLTDNWLELTVRFIAREHGVRQLKSDMSRDILERLTAMQVTIASTTIEVVGAPQLRVSTTS
ncbi:MAG TPA: mechanosensitive ion channel domain-containing protein [Thermoanaerobaculia bacterium]|nr:mechanosensitive ion channel domain-containing protein [Thermoanaerobaculia bacterium]